MGHMPRAEAREAEARRRKLAGEICVHCSKPLRPPPPAPRSCPQCEPRDCRVTCNVFASGWCVHFMDADGKTGIGPWLLFDSEAEVREKVFAWGHADTKGFEQSLQTYGRGSVVLYLTRAERAGLIARARGWPWTGYELEQMKAAGRYPPKRLTPAQEQAFLSERQRRDGRR